MFRRRRGWHQRRSSVEVANVSNDSVAFDVEEPIVRERYGGDPYLQGESRVAASIRAARATANARALRIGGLIERHKMILLNLLVLSTLITTSVVWGLFQEAAESDAVVERPSSFVVIDDPANSFHEGCSNLTCRELRANLIKDTNYTVSRLVAVSERALNDDGSLCVCGPMFGFRHRHIAVRDASRKITHAFNPVISGASEERSHMLESLEPFFLGATSPVQNVRSDVVQLDFVDRDCRPKSARIAAPLSYCVQICVDLLNGTSPYQRNASGVE